MDLERTFTFRNSKQTYSGIPIIVANMDTVGTFEMAVVMAQVGWRAFPLCCSHWRGCQDPPWTCSDTLKRKGRHLGPWLWPNYFVLSLNVAGVTFFLPPFQSEMMGGVWTCHSVRWSRATSISSWMIPMIVLEIRDTERRGTLCDIVKLVEAMLC